MEQGKSLTRKEFDAVMRRATELAFSDTSSEDLSETELYRIAREVGVPERHIRRALVEMRTGGLASGTLDRLFGPEVVRAARVVEGALPDLSREIDQFLVSGQLLQPIRRGSGILQYRPAVDWVSQVARAASATSRRYYVASAKSVEVHLAESERGHTLVEFEVDPGTRGDAVGGALFGGGALGVAGGIATGIGLAVFAPVPLAVVMGTAVGSAALGGTTYWVGRSHQNKIRDVRAEVEGILDQLELGEPLEPPPPSWREWVKRQFHGARKLLVELEGEPEGPPSGGAGS